jgi:hypothetical protein
MVAAVSAINATGAIERLPQQVCPNAILEV